MLYLYHRFPDIHFMSPITGRKNLLGLFIAATMLLGLTSVAAAEKLEAGFAAVDITPPSLPGLSNAS